MGSRYKLNVYTQFVKENRLRDTLKIYMYFQVCYTSGKKFKISSIRNSMSFSNMSIRM